MIEKQSGEQISRLEFDHILSAWAPEDEGGEDTQLAQKIKRAEKTHFLWASLAIWWLLSSPPDNTNC